jgi:hypothetical protein
MFMVPAATAPKYRPASLISMSRPNGKLYKAQKPPAAHLIEDDGQVTAVLVIRTDDYLHARDLAQFELETFDTVYAPVTPYFGWWRQTIRDGEDYWEQDEVRGAPGYFFKEIVEKSN